MASRDWDCLDDARAKLLATGAFDAVYRSALPETRGRPSSDTLAACVAPKDWEEVSTYDDPTAVEALRKVTWTLTLFVRLDDPEQRERTLDRLLSVAQNTLDGQSLAGLTICDRTRLGRGRYETAKDAEQRMTVTGSFEYFVAGVNGHDTSA